MAGQTTKCPKCNEPIAIGDPTEVDTETEGDNDDSVPQAKSRVGGRRALRADSVPTQNLGKAVLVAALAAIAGTLVWTGIVYGTGYQIGFLAWGIGAGIGGAAALAGGRGMNMAVVCGALALASIVSGWYLSSYLLIQELLSPEVYAATRTDATEWNKVSHEPTREAVAAYMIAHGYTDRAEPKYVPDEQIAAFKEETVPYLESFHSKQPSIGEWRGELVTLNESVASDLDVRSFLFLVLGVVSAGGIVLKFSRQDAAQARAAAKEERRGSRNR